MVDILLLQTVSMAETRPSVSKWKHELPRRVGSILQNIGIIMLVGGLIWALVAHSTKSDSVESIVILLSMMLLGALLGLLGYRLKEGGFPPYVYVEDWGT